MSGETTISALPDVVSLDGSEVVPLDQGTDTKKATTREIGQTLLSQANTWSQPQDFGAGFTAAAPASVGGANSGEAYFEVPNVTDNAEAAKFGAALPIYVGANQPTLGMNLRWDGSKNVYGAGSTSNYAGLLTYLTTTGQYLFLGTTAPGAAGDDATSVLVTLFSVDKGGDATFAGTVKTGAQTVSELGSAATAGAGARAWATDCTNTFSAANFGAIENGGGSNGCPLVSDGANWRVG